MFDEDLYTLYIQNQQLALDFFRDKALGDSSLEYEKILIEKAENIYTLLKT